MSGFGAVLVSLVAVAAAHAADPVFVTSKPDAGWSTEGYYVHNNMWGRKDAVGPCTQTLHAWSYSDWYVVAKMGRDPEDGGIKAYPNTHKDYDDVPVRSFDTITSTFVVKSPGAGTYNVGYDIWLNNPPGPGHNEVMIWTDNQSSWNRKPSGKHVDTVTFGGRTYKAFRTDNGTYMAFLVEENFNAGSVDVLEILRWATDKGWLKPDSTLDQICFGVEIGSTVGTDGIFRFSNVTIDSNIAPVVELTTPGRDTNYAAPATVALAATASDADGKVTKVDFYHGTKLLGTASAAPYAFAWNDVPAGAYVLTARAKDDFGTTVSSVAVPITVSSAVAHLVKPEDGLTVGGLISVEATAHDVTTGTKNGAGITGVTFEVLSSGRAVSRCEDLAPPYVWMLDTRALAAGTYGIRVTATSATVGTAAATGSLRVDNSTDTDGDGLVDGWEHFYYGGLALGAEDDFDGDGATNGDELQGGTVPTDAGSVPDDALVKTLVAHVKTNAASLGGHKVYYRMGRGAPEPMKFLSADGDGLQLENRGLRLVATWQSLDREAVYRLMRPLAADAPARIKVATLLLGGNLGHASSDRVSDLLGKLYGQDADAARFVDSILRDRPVPPDLPIPFEWNRREQ